MSDDIRDLYQMVDVNVYQENIFHTKMMLNDFDLNQYLFGTTTSDLPQDEIDSITDNLFREMREIFYARNLPEMPFN
jgi:S-adenosylmethionine decarboxylase